MAARELLHYSTFAVELLALGERAMHVRRIVGGREAIVLLSEAITLTPRETPPATWQMDLPMNTAKECGLVE